MEKKDYLNLQSKYSYLQDLQERYHHHLIDFIRESFEKHDNKFEYKCDTHATWQEKNEDEDDDFDAMNDLPMCITVWVDEIRASVREKLTLRSIISFANAVSEGSHSPSEL